jgi:hypothetical protein
MDEDLPAVTVSAEFVVTSGVAPAVRVRLLDLAEQLAEDFGAEIIDSGVN